MQVGKSYQKFFKDKSRLVLLYGGAGSGKSYAAQSKIIMRMLSETGHKFLVIRKVGKTLKSSVYDLFITIIENEGLSSDFNCTTTPLEITHIPTGNKILFANFDAESKEKIKSIADISGIFVEEATEIEYEDYLQLNLRLRGITKNYKQIIFSFNPISMRSWIYEKFFKEKLIPAKIYHTTYKDNPFIDPEYKIQLEELSVQNELYAKIYARGEWASLDNNIVFKAWRTQKLPYDISKYKVYSASADFGFSHASVALVVAHTDKEIHILREVYYKELTNPEFIDKIKKEIPNWKDLVFYLDSAEPARIKEFRQHGFAAIGVKKGKGSIGFAIDFLLRKPIIIDESCKNTIQEFGDFSYLKDEKTGIIWPDKFENDGLYDCMAALRYSQNHLMRKTNKLRAVKSFL